MKLFYNIKILLRYNEIGELYDNQDDKNEYFDDKIYVYSMSLTNESIDLWNYLD